MADTFEAVVANAGVGGANFAMDTFVDASGNTRVMPFSALVTPDGSGYSRMTAMPVIGTFYQATQPISAASLPLPTGAATDAGLASIDGHFDGIEALLSSLDGNVIECNTGAVVIAASALPTGAASAAKQDTLNTSIGSIDSKTPALGQALAAASVPVVLTASQLTTLTPLSSVSISGTVTVGPHNVTNAGTFPVQVDGAALTSLQLIDDTIFTDDAAFTPGASKVQSIGLQADETATDSVDEGDIGCPRMTLDRKQIVTERPHTSGGCSIYSFLSTAAVQAAAIKASPGQVYGLEMFNKNSRGG